MNKYREFIETCHPELLQEADGYVVGVNVKEKAKRQIKKQQELDETRKRIPWYNFPFTYKQLFANGEYEETDTSNISFRDAFAMFTDHFWHEKFKPIPNLDEAPCFRKTALISSAISLLFSSASARERSLNSSSASFFLISSSFMRYISN